LKNSSSFSLLTTSTRGGRSSPTLDTHATASSKNADATGGGKGWSIEESTTDMRQSS
jgi:hypothetical protein